MSRIAHITDIHLDETSPKIMGVFTRQNWELMLADIKSKNVDFIVFGGDIGEVSSFPYFIETLNHTQIPYHVVLGNHEKYPDLKPFLVNDKSLNKNELYYTFEDDRHQYFILDSSRNKISNMQQNWFESEVLKATKKIIVFMHHPVLEVQSRVDIDYPLLKRKKFIKILHKIPKEMVFFCGHYHTEHAKNEQNIHQYITPSGAMQILQNTDTLQFNPNEFGYRYIDLSKDDVETRNITFYVS